MRAWSSPWLQLTVALGLSAGWFVAGQLGARVAHVGLVLGLYAMAAALVVVAVARRDLRPLLRPDLRPIVIGVTAGAALTGATYLVYPILADLLPVIVGPVRRLYAVAPAPAVIMPLMALTGLVEELIWRGLLLEGLRGVLDEGPRGALGEGPRGALGEGLRGAERLRGWGTPVAAVLATVVYAAAQAGAGGVLLFVVALALGGVWTLERLWTGSLLAPMLTHVIWTLTVIAAFPLEAAAG